MYAFIKSRKDFSTTGKTIPQDWDIPVLSSESDEGQVIIPKEDKKDFSNDWLYLDGHLYLIDSSTPNEGTIELSVKNPSAMFNRQHFYPEEPADTYGEFIAEAITKEYINCEDPEYRIPYLVVHNTDDTLFEEPELDATKLYSLEDIISDARQRSVIIDFTVEGKNMGVYIYSGAGRPHNIIFDDGHSSLESESFSRKKTAKITILKSTDNQDEYDISTWYLSESGEISEEIPENRASGDWIYLTINKEDDPHDKAAEKFKENISSHKIEFRSDRKYNLWDTVKFEIDGEILVSSILAIIYSSDDDRYLYRCGDLATTLTDRLSKVENNI